MHYMENNRSIFIAFENKVCYDHKVKRLTKLVSNNHMAFGSMVMPLVSEQTPCHGFESQSRRPISWIKISWYYV